MQHILLKNTYHNHFFVFFRKKCWEKFLSGSENVCHMLWFKIPETKVLFFNHIFSALFHTPSVERCASYTISVATLSYAVQEYITANAARCKIRWSSRWPDLDLQCHSSMKICSLIKLYSFTLGLPETKLSYLKVVEPEVNSDTNICYQADFLFLWIIFPL